MTTTTKLVLLKLLILTHGSYSALADQSQNRSEFYTSVVRMEQLLQTELAILDRLDAFIVKSEDQLRLLKRKRDRFHAEISGAAENPIPFVSNPISAFLMTKRLVKDYWEVDALIRKGVGVEVIAGSTVLPSEEDLQGIAEGLSRLQEVYKMKAVELALGKVYGHNPVRELTVEECYRIGKAMAQGQCFANANQWFREALLRLRVEESLGVSRFEILDYYSYSLSEVGRYKEALELTNELLEINSTYVGGIVKKKVIEDWLYRIEKSGRKRKRPTSALLTLYEKLCRGDYVRPVEVTSQLFCRYETSASAFLQLAPLKQEAINLDPFIVIYHEAVTDREITRLIELARPQIKRSAVGDTKNELVSKYRISQNTWLGDDDDPLVATINRRAKDMAGGLNEQSYEKLQVNNYGLGGFYSIHYDWSRNAVPFPNMGVGNRIATLMFYLSDVEQGGATVFPRLNLAVRPRKGTAIFWYNLRRNGKGDKRTLHAACPVLVGSKWVANKWIHEYHQEFVRPCELDPKK
uniref:procollagen-proline 4-dioxygenase n=1 Tax=Culex tarsalis TaxID=7177 RepID=A0A1Q3FSW3_CULTA